MDLKSGVISECTYGDVGSVYFGPYHPMKPHRLCMTHHLLFSYELHKKMEIYRPHKSYPVELAQFHSEDYVEFLHRIIPDTQHMFTKELIRWEKIVLYLRTSLSFVRFMPVAL